MADSRPTEVHPRPPELHPRPKKVNPHPQEDSPRSQKTPKLGKPDEESITTTKYARFRLGNPESDEYIRQYLLFYYDFKRTQGFGIQWDKFDFFFPQCKPCDGPGRFDGDKTNEEVVEEMTRRAIAKHNAENGTNIVLVEPIDANHSFHGYLEFWITFRAKDMSSPSPEPKIYQANTLSRAGTILLPIFRVKPTDEEMAAAPIDVDLPDPIFIDCDKPPVVFSFAGLGDDPVPGTPYTFNRNPPEEEW